MDHSSLVGAEKEVWPYPGERGGGGGRGGGGAWQGGGRGGGRGGVWPILQKHTKL